MENSNTDKCYFSYPLPQVMGAIFNICQGKNSCNDIATPINNVILEQSLLYKSQERELQADNLGTKYITEVGYHPSGLKGYLLTIAYIEKKVQKKTQGIPKDVSNFFYRHPKTPLRIKQVDSQILNNHLRNHSVKRLNQKVYNTLLYKENLLPKSKKIKTLLDNLHKVISKKEYYDIKE